MKKIFSLLLLCLVILNLNSQAEATIVKGYAAIMNGDISAARAEARRQAMRELVEQVVGVRVQSSVEVVNNMLVRDEILAKSDGYVTINKIIKEENRGDVFYVEMDITADANKIKLAAIDLKSRVQNNVTDSNSRGGIFTAVVLRDRGRYSYDKEFATYINDKLKLVGFDAKVNDVVAGYLEKSGDAPNVGIQARTMARQSEDRGGVNALLRGVLAIEEVKKIQGGQYQAMVKASFELIGLDSDSVDVFSKYFKSVKDSEFEAIEEAKQRATEEAMKSLAEQALETVQQERQGGYTNIKTTVIVDDISDYSSQFPQIKAALEKAHCRIIRVARPTPTRISLYVSSDAYSSVGELGAFLSAIKGFEMGLEQTGAGTTKIQLLFKGGA